MKRKPQNKRGRHKRATSPETHAWEVEHLPPECPEWMDAAVWRGLVALRKRLDRLA